MSSKPSVCKGSDFQKTKFKEHVNQRIRNEERDSGLCTESARKRRKWQPKNGGLDPTAEAADRKGMLHKYVENDKVKVEDGNPLKACKVEVNERVSGIREAFRSHVDLSGTREHMATVIDELKEAKERMLAWMRKELKKFSKRNHEFSLLDMNFCNGGEFQGSEQNRHVNDIGLPVLDNGSNEIDFGAECSDSGGFGIEDFSRDLNGRGQVGGKGIDFNGFLRENEFLGRGDYTESDFRDSVCKIDGRMEFGDEVKCDPGCDRPSDLTFATSPTVSAFELKGCSYYTLKNSTVDPGAQNVEIKMHEKGKRKACEDASSFKVIETRNISTNSDHASQTVSFQAPNDEKPYGVTGLNGSSMQANASVGTWNNVGSNSGVLSQNGSFTGAQCFEFGNDWKTYTREGNCYRCLPCNAPSYRGTSGMLISPSNRGTSGMLISPSQPSTVRMQYPSSMQVVPDNTRSLQPFISQPAQPTLPNCHHGFQNFLGLGMGGNINSSVAGEGSIRRLAPETLLYDNSQSSFSGKPKELPDSNIVNGKKHVKMATEHNTDILKLNG